MRAAPFRQVEVYKKGRSKEQTEFVAQHSGLVLETRDISKVLFISLAYAHSFVALVRTFSGKQILYVPIHYLQFYASNGQLQW
jgi:hypothetical protein